MAAPDSNTSFHPHKPLKLICLQCHPTPGEQLPSSIQYGGGQDHGSGVAPQEAPDSKFGMIYVDNATRSDNASPPSNEGNARTTTTFYHDCPSSESLNRQLSNQAMAEPSLGDLHVINIAAASSHADIPSPSAEVQSAASRTNTPAPSTISLATASLSSVSTNQPTLPADPQPASFSTNTTIATPTPSLLPTLLALAQPRPQAPARGIKRPYSPQPNRIGAQQTYTMNRFADEVMDFRAALLSLDDQSAIRRIKRRKVALSTRLMGLEVMIGV